MRYISLDNVELVSGQILPAGTEFEWEGDPGRLTGLVRPAFMPLESTRVEIARVMAQIIQAHIDQRVREKYLQLAETYAAPESDPQTPAAPESDPQTPAASDAPTPVPTELAAPAAPKTKK